MLQSSKYLTDNLLSSSFEEVNDGAEDKDKGSSEDEADGEGEHVDGDEADGKGKGREIAGRNAAPLN